MMQWYAMLGFVTVYGNKSKATSELFCRRLKPFVQECIIEFLKQV